MSQKNFIHPYIFFVTEFGLSDPLEKLRENDWTGALRSLTDFCLALDPDIKELLKAEIDELRLWRYKNQGIDEAKLIETFDKIFNALHAAGYFLGAKMIPPRKDQGNISDLEQTMERHRRRKK